MGVYYDFYLERHIGNDKWVPIKIDGSEIIYSVRGRAFEFQNEYGASFPMSFQSLNEEYKKKNREKYDASNEPDKHFLANFYWMDLLRIKKDYEMGLHENAGIISKNSYKRLQSDPYYNPKVIDEEVYAAFSDEIKGNYMYHEWDDDLSEYYYLYEIMPLVNKALKDNGLTIDEVRLLCRIN